MNQPRVYADFHNADSQGRLRLNCTGTVQDLARQKVQLREGLALTLYSDDEDAESGPDDLQADGTVRYNEEERCWVAEIDWGAVRHASDAKAPVDQHQD